MSVPLSETSSAAETRQRFEDDVDGFLKLEAGQAAALDTPLLVMQWIKEAAVAVTSPIRRVLDNGCGAVNSAIKLRQDLGYDFNADLLVLGPKDHKFCCFLAVKQD